MYTSWLNRYAMDFENVLKQKNQEVLALCKNIQFPGAEAIFIKPKLLQIVDCNQTRELKKSCTCQANINSL